jgi:predicted nuclease with TOPRIM domain
MRRAHKETAMRERLAELKAEFEVGQQRLQALDQQRAGLRDTLLRISGAIQVLEELLAQEAHSDQVQQEAEPATSGVSGLHA